MLAVENFPMIMICPERRADAPFLFVCFQVVLFIYSNSEKKIDQTFLSFFSICIFFLTDSIAFSYFLETRSFFLLFRTSYFIRFFLDNFLILITNLSFFFIFIACCNEEYFFSFIDLLWLVSSFINSLVFHCFFTGSFTNSY